MLCRCKNCRAALPSIYCVATRTLSEAEARRVKEILDRAASRDQQREFAESLREPPHDARPQTEGTV